MIHIVHVYIEITEHNNTGRECAEVGEKGGEFINETLVGFGWAINSGYYGRCWSRERRDPPLLAVNYRETSSSTCQEGLTE